MLLAATRNHEIVLPFLLRAGDHGEGLKVGIRARGFEAEALVAFFDQALGAGDAFCAGAATFHRRSSQRFDVVDVALRIGGGEWRRRRQRNIRAGQQ